MTALPRIKSYRILRQLGSGGMGRVYEAITPLFCGATQSVAIKIPHPNRQSGQAQDLFARELKTAIELNHRHPNLVTVHTGGETDEGEPFMVMELIDGTTVSELCARESLDPQIARRVARVLLDAFQYLHRCGVVHRDVKPSNVMIGRDGHITLSDFGLAKPLDSSQSGHFHGTPAYASPEQLRGNAATPASDLFSLGVVLFRMLTGRRPFEASDIETLLASMERGTPTMPRDVPFDLSRLVTGLLESNPDERLTADEAQTLLSSNALPMASDEEIAMLVAARLADVEVKAPTIADEKTESAPGGPVLPGDAGHAVVDSVPQRRARWAMALAAVAVLLTLVIGTNALWLTPGEQSASSPTAEARSQAEPEATEPEPLAPVLPRSSAIREPAAESGELEREAKSTESSTRKRSAVAGYSQPRADRATAAKTADKTASTPRYEANPAAVPEQPKPWANPGGWE